MGDLTAAELARRYGVARSTVARALTRAAERHHTDPTGPALPAPVNPGEPQLRYRVDEMDRWWPHRPTRGRPTKRTSHA